MDSRPHESSWIDAGEPLSFAELGRACAMAPAELDELVEFGALVPLGRNEEGLVFAAECLLPLREAARLRSDFDLDLFTAGLLLRYLQRIESLERRVKSLEARLPVHAHHPEREGPDLWHEPRPAKAGVARS
jgi:chaperone modulatory protein CbpM